MGHSRLACVGIASSGRARLSALSVPELPPRHAYSRPRPNTADLGCLLWLLSPGGGRFGGFHDGDGVVGSGWIAMVRSLEFPVGHFAFDHAGVAPAAAGDEVAQDFTDGSTHCPGQP